MSKTIEKIKKLLNLSECTGATEHEADTARLLAERLMAAAGLTEKDVADHEEEEAYTWEAVTVKSKTKNRSSWKGIIAVACARIAGAFVHSASSEGKHAYVWVGTADQRETAMELFAWVSDQIDRLTVAAVKSGKASGHLKSWMNAYRLGVASSIATQAMELMSSKPVPLKTGPALVRQNETDKKLAAYKDSKNLRASGSSKVSNGAAFGAGQNDGSSVRLRNDVPGSTVRKLGAGSF